MGTVIDTYVPVGATQEWMVHYLRDWGACGIELRRFRLYSTVLRWFDRPADRLANLNRGLRFSPRSLVKITEQHETNVLDLLGVDVAVGPGYSAVNMGFFLASLDDGDMLRGAPVTEEPAFFVSDVRPGYAWLWFKWILQFGQEPMPWPFWLFPNVDELAQVPP